MTWTRWRALSKQSQSLMLSRSSAVTSRGNYRAFAISSLTTWVIVFHFRSALITFRRIWMKGDTENFDHICNIIWRFTTPPPNVFLKFIRNAVHKELNEASWPRPIDVTGRELVDLWLNAVFAHSGLSGRTKLRHRFDALIDRYGSGRLEFAFRHIVWALGIQYKNVVQLAKNLLENWDSRFGMKASFRPGAAFGTKRRERTSMGNSSSEKVHPSTSQRKATNSGLLGFSVAPSSAACRACLRTCNLLIANWCASFLSMTVTQP